MPQQTLEQFGQTVKAKYPQYATLSDTDVANKVLEKYPQYKAQVANQPAPQPAEQAPLGNIDSALQAQLQDRGQAGKLNELQQAAGQADVASQYAGGTGAVTPRDVAKLTSHYVGQGINAVGKALDYTGIPQVVGGAVATIGAPIGAIVGVAGKAIQNVATNQPVGQGVLQSAQQVAGQTGQFGYQTGKAATETAPLGLAGRVPGAIIAAGQGYGGLENVGQAIKTGNVEQGFQGALDVAQGLVGLHGAVNAKGAIYNPEAVQTAKEVGNAIGEKARGAVEGVKTKLNDVVYNDTIKTYKEVLNQTQREIQGETKWNKNTPKLLADNGIIPQAENGRLKNAESIKEVKDKMSQIGDNLSAALESKPTTINLNESKALALDNIKKQKGLSALEQNKQMKAVESFFDAEIARNGDNPIVSGSRANEIKQGAWNTTFDLGDKVGSNAIYQAGHVIKDQIEAAYPDANIRAINKELGDWAAAKRFLEKSEGRRLRGSFFGNMGARFGGGAVGTMIGGPLGGIIGQEVGSRIQRKIIDPQFRLGTRQKALEVLKPKTVLDGFKETKTPYDTPDIIRLRQENAATPSTHLINTPERTQLREQVKAQVLAKQPNVRRERVANIVIGPPAAGKSKVFAEPLSKKYGARIIDSDMAKELLPEFDGGKRAGAVHEESDMISGDIYRQSIGDGENIVLPLVGKNQEKIIRMAEELKKKGYTVNLFLNELSANQAVKRAVERFKSTGRFVDPAYVLDVGDKPTRTFNAIKNNPLFDYYEHRNNSVPFGQEPKIVETKGTLKIALQKQAAKKKLTIPKMLKATQENTSLSAEAKKYTSAKDFYEKMSSSLRDKLREKGIKGQEQVTDFWNKSTGGGSNVPKKVLDNLNPTGGVFVDYKPQERAKMALGKNITTLDKTSGKPANELITIYRGAPKNQKKIVPGDFITTSYDVAKSYIGGEGHVLEATVKLKDVLDDITEPLGDEYIYRPIKK